MSKYVYNPRTGQMELEQKRPEDYINLMSIKPNRSCWIKVLQNRVLLNSVGNMRYAKELYYDRATDTLSSTRDMEDAVLFRTYMLPNCGRPAGWIYINK